MKERVGVPEGCLAKMMFCDTFCPSAILKVDANRARFSMVPASRVSLLEKADSATPPTGHGHLTRGFSVIQVLLVRG